MMTLSPASEARPCTLPTRLCDHGSVVRCLCYCLSLPTNCTSLLMDDCEHSRCSCKDLKVDTQLIASKGTKYQVPHSEDSRSSKNCSFCFWAVSSSLCLKLFSPQFMEVSLPTPISLKTKSLFSSRKTRDVVCIEALFARIFLPLFECSGSLQWPGSSHLVALRTAGWQN